jgi:hypothetical protein
MPSFEDDEFHPVIQREFRNALLHVCELLLRTYAEGNAHGRQESQYEKRLADHFQCTLYKTRIAVGRK